MDPCPLKLLEHGSSRQSKSISPVVRVSDSQEHTLLRALETGVRSVMVPRCEYERTSRAMVRFCKYFPEGAWIVPYTTVHDYADNIAISYERKEDTLIGLLVEGQQGLANLEEIASVDGVDLIYLGLFDICQSVGLPVKSMIKVLDEIKRCGELMRAKGVAIGSMSKR